MDYVSLFLSFVGDGLKWAKKHIGYVTHVQSEINKLKEEMGKLEEVCTDVRRKVDTAHERFQPVKEQVDGWKSRVQAFKEKVNVDIQLPLNCSYCSCTVCSHNCWTRHQLGKRVVTEHKEDVAKLINEGKEYADGTVVDPTLPFPIEKNIIIIRDDAKRLRDVEADINSRVEAAKRRRLLLPKSQVEGWIELVSEHKNNVSAIDKQFEDMEKSDCREMPLWVELSHKAEKLLKEIEKLINEGRSFEDVADPSRPVVLVEQAHVRTIGQEEAYDEVLGLIKNEEVRRIGIHGMGGVGKTTLLKRINNSFTESDFELIIWVTVSKDFTISEIQQKIMERCGMKDQNNTPLDQKESNIRNFLKDKRYVLLLDDMWESLDLNSLGVPPGDNEVKSKLLITSRSEGVCDIMKATKVPLGCLNPNDAWELFRAKVEAILSSDPKIEELAKHICQYCGGLPLALEVIGTAMSEKHTLYEWSDAKNTLEKHATGFEDSEGKLFSCLRLSYDSLKNNTMRECFCYCALFREDWKINTFDLVSCWIGEGFFQHFECDNIDEARDRGYTIICDLIKASLLKEVEDGIDETSAISDKMFNIWEVAMHDVIRDMALRIKKDEFKINKGKFGVEEISGTKTRLGLITTFGEDDLTERQRKELAQFGKSAPNLSTLITTGKGVTLFTDDMLEAMNKLRVLHVYGECELPPSIGRLRDLRCLNLSHNVTFESVEVLAELGSLMLLIMEVPSSKLSFEGVIQRLSKLQALILRYYDYDFGVEDIGVSIIELESLPCLEDLQLFISTESFLKGLANSRKLARCVSNLNIKSMDISCFGLIQDVGSMVRLKLLIIECSLMREVVIKEEQGYTLCNLTLLSLLLLYNLKKFEVSMEPINSLQSLKNICIIGCIKLRFAYMGWPLPGLEVLDVRGCDKLEEIFKISGGSGVVFSALRIILIKECRKLKIICSDAFCFPRLQILDVRDCGQLKRLPRGVIQARKESLREIRGSQRWWDALTWDSEEDKMSLLPLFRSNGNTDDHFGGGFSGVESEDNISDDSEEDYTGDDYSEEDDSEEDNNIGDDHSEEDI